MGPVRVGNQAYQQVQHDVFGSVILAVTQSFFDTRLVRKGDEELYRQLARLGKVAVARFGVPDAGIWELRTRASVHTFSALMRSEEHTSELQSLMRISYAVFCLKKKINIYNHCSRLFHTSKLTSMQY